MSVAIQRLFPTHIAQGRLADARALNRELTRDIEGFMAEDRAGQAWSRRHYRGGYTSYASLDDMNRRAPSCEQLEILLRPHVSAYARALGWRLAGRRLRMTTCWMNVMPRHTYHTLHLHPHSVISGTYYVSTPPGCVPLRLEDPRMAFYMHAPPRTGKRVDGHYVDIKARAGAFVLFESWLRHEVPPNRSTRPRISVSFNYGLE
ncbi:MAG: hypothetical protein K8T26_00210 [Lentisphaerae bacterium]|nr:hypothetical protein [Lentisphaerota bacterium]